MTRSPIRSDPPDRRRARFYVPATPRGPAQEADARGPERAVLVGILLPDTTADLSDPLGELAALAGSAGVEVVDSMIQKRMALESGHALGTGKLEELAERVGESHANVVIFDNDLSPRHIRGVENAVNCKVIDRAELILDIFASRATTREAKLQVELAQLEYTSPRLRGLWTHLERIAGAGGATAAGAVGGVGTRGPGERQIEVDRRVVRKRITHLKREIREIDRRKQREVRARRAEFTVALVGYTNSGKSTLMNRVAGAGRLAGDRPFTTLDTKTARWELGQGRVVLLSDTVGFIRNLPHQLVASFRATLEEALHADLLLHVVDISSHRAWQQVEAVDEVLAGIGCDSTPQVTLLNKIDIADDASTVELMSRRGSKCLCASAKTGAGIDALAAEIVGRMDSQTTTVRIRVPQREGRLLAELDRLANVLRRAYVGSAVELDVQLDCGRLAQFRGRYPALTILETDGKAPAERTAEGLE